MVVFPDPDVPWSLIRILKYHLSMLKVIQTLEDVDILQEYRRLGYYELRLRLSSLHG